MVSIRPESSRHKAAIIFEVPGGIGSVLVPGFEATGWDGLSVGAQALERRAHGVSDLARLADQQSNESKALIEELGRHTVRRLRALIHNAAWQVVKPSSGLTSEDWARTLSVNLSALLLNEHGLPGEPACTFMNGASIDLSGGISSRLHDPL